MSVKVTTNSTGAVVIPSENNPEYGYVRVESVEPMFVNGWLRKVVKSALIQGKTEELREVFIPNMILPGRIQVIESLNAPEGPNSERFIKKSGTEGVILRVDDQPIYRTTMYDSTGTSTDVLLQHTNVEEVKEYAAKQRAALAGGGVTL